MTALDASTTATATPPPAPAAPAPVQAVGSRTGDLEPRPWESAGVFVLFTALYAVVGQRLVVQLHVVAPETLDRFERSVQVLHDGPLLPSVGTDLPPLSVLLLTPFTAIPALARSLLAVPLVSAVFAGLTLMVVHTMLRRAGVVLGWRVAMLVALGLNPLVVMYATTGARPFLWLASLVAALGALFAWYVTAHVRFVMLAGLGYAMAGLAGYGSLAWFLVSLVMLVVILARLGADGREIEGTTVAFVVPTVCAITLWSTLGLLRSSAPFAWITDGAATDAARATTASFHEIVTGTVELVVRGAPLAIAVLPMLLCAAITRRDRFALWLALMLGVAVVAPGLAVAWQDGVAPPLMSDALPVLLLSVVGGIWLVRSAPTRGTLVTATLVGVLALSIPWTFAAMPGFAHQGLERAFHEAVVTGEPQEGARTADGAVVGFDDELDMATFIRDRVGADASILTDGDATYGVLLLTGSPGTFLDRADEPDGAWSRAAEHPAGRVDYLLLSTDPDGDLLAGLYPEAGRGADPGLPVAHANRGYTLLEVPRAYGHHGASQTLTGSGSTP